MRITNFCAFFVCDMLLAVTAAHSEPLTDALVAAYSTNPTLLARQAQSRAADEAVPQALANWRPTVSLTGDTGFGKFDSNDSSSGTQYRRTKDATLTFTQPLYRGGRTVAATKQAESNIEADRAQLLGVEQSVLLDAATAYMTVVRDAAVLRLNINNEQVLQRQLQAAEDRFRVGEITRTDVAQSEARLAGATADRIKSEGNLEASRANYERVVGVPPENPVASPSIDNLPKSLEETVSLAISNNPIVVAANHTYEASRHAIDLARGALLPTISLTGDVSKTLNTGTVKSWSREAQGLITVSVPLYEQGTVYSQVRQAKSTAGQQRLTADDARRRVVDGAKQSWETLQTTRAQIVSLQTQIASAETALEGVRRESQVGSRTVLDVLNAEQELLNARVALVGAEREERVAEFTVMGAIGRLTALGLELPTVRYNPQEHYKDVRNQWIGGNKKADDDASGLAGAR